MTEFNYINTIENAEKTVFDVQMSDKLSINYWNNIEYIETDSENIKIEVIHPKYLDVYISKENEIIDVKYITKNEDIIQQIRDIIDGIIFSKEQIQRNKKLYSNCICVHIKRKY